MAWFVYDPEGDGYNEYSTEEEARIAAENCREHWEMAAEEDGEWAGDFLPQLRWGKVMGRGRIVEHSDGSGDGVIESA